MNINRTARRAAHTIPFRALTVAAVVFAMAAVSASAQQTTASTGSGKEMTIEELFLRSVEFQILREKAFADDYDLKMSALDDIEKKLQDGSYATADQQVEFVLDYLAMEGSARTTRENRRLINNFPEVRRRAAEMLGRLGTDAAKDTLIRVILVDDEPVVKAEAAYALGLIGKNPDNQVVQTLAFVYNQEDPTKPDNNFGYALCLAIEKLSQKTTIKDPIAYQMLVKIAQGNYLRTVRNKALQVLDVLKSSK